MCDKAEQTMGSSSPSQQASDAAFGVGLGNLLNTTSARPSIESQVYKDMADTEVRIAQLRELWGLLRMTGEAVTVSATMRATDLARSLGYR